MSDVIPEAIRSQAYGLMLAGYFGGYSLAPSMTIILRNDAAVAMFSFLCSIVAFLAATWYVPETLPDQIPNVPDNLLSIEQIVRVESNENIEIVQTTYSSSWLTNNLLWMLRASTRPLREISILARNRKLQLISTGSFCSAMVFSIDATLVIYYIEETLNVQKSDIAIMTLALGIAGILIQGVLIHPIVSSIGEKGSLILAFSCGTLHNFLYGSARTKVTIYAALILSQLTKTNIPILSSIASKQVAPTEQGRIQGALFAINAVGNAVGPILVQFIDHHARHNFGPGSMFVYASILYAIGTIVVSRIPQDSPSIEVPILLTLEYEEENLHEPLLTASDNPDTAEETNNNSSSSS
jgi:Na+/melibiose symporter-like transporter